MASARGGSQDLGGGGRAIRITGFLADTSVALVHAEAGMGRSHEGSADRTGLARHLHEASGYGPGRSRKRPGTGGR